MRSLLVVMALLAVCELVIAFAPPHVQAAPPSGPPEPYTVQAGDTLYSISVRFHTTVDALKRLNGLTGDTIRVGQQLLIPSDDSAPSAPTPSTTYVVQPGDSLYRIALRYGTTTRAIMDLNGIPNPNLVSTGQALAIPQNAALVQPGLTLEPSIVQEGGTLVVKLARPGLTSVIGKWGGDRVSFTRAGGYYYGLFGVSRCANVGPATLQLTATDSAGVSSTISTTFTVASTAFQVQSLTLAPSVAALLDPTLVKREAEQLAAIVARYTPTRLWRGAFRVPVSGQITSHFGTRRSYNKGPVGECGHEGTDFSGATGTPVYADARGRVTFAGPTQVRGNMVVVDHGLGVHSGYYHLSEVGVQVGQMVEASDVIGKVGSTGLSTGSHLHWSMWVNGEYVDPIEWTRRLVP